ncbi:unnamed protein product [Pelagomonas calceolata]|uniref:Casein kinase I n=1 Tax=Pelagomonas calceolata TaxID=35677 RepID=A0A8J2WKE6_9STRA|nr:unnamed protein product [Pelagomonas calceolata]
MPVLSRNQVLKGEFRVGARLGEGACAEVYCCERVQGAKLSRAQKLQQSDADLVVKAAPIPPQSKKKAKDYMDKKRAADTLFAEHLLYANVLNRHPRRFGTKVGYGEDQNCRYLVLERLGPSLGDEMAETRLTPQQLASIGADCLASLEVLHAQKYVYCDMKPENIMLGTCSSGRIRDKDQARLVDFGVATRYVSAVSGKHKAEDEGGGQAGTPRFASLASSSSPPARRDDVEALAYVLLCAAADDRLPWDSAQSDEAVLAAKKKCGDAYGVLAALEDDLVGFAGDARPLGDFLADARALAHNAAPDYERLRGHLRTLAASSSKRRRSGAPASSKRRKAPAPMDESSSEEEDEAPRRPPPRRRAVPMDCDAPPPPPRRAARKAPAARKPAAPRKAPARKSPKRAPPGRPDVSIEALLAKARAAKAKK